MKTVFTLLFTMTLVLLMTTLNTPIYGQDPGYQSTTPSGSQASMPQDKLIRLDQHRDIKVTNANNEDLGKITDFVIDKPQGHIAYAVLHYGHGKYFAVPWSALSLSADGKYYTVDTTKQKLDQAQGFDKQWPAQPDTTLFTTGGPSEQYKRVTADKGRVYDNGTNDKQENAESRGTGTAVRRFRGCWVL